MTTPKIIKESILYGVSTFDISNINTFTRVIANRTSATARKCGLFFLKPFIIMTTENSVHKTDIEANRADGTYSWKKYEVSTFKTSVKAKAAYITGASFLYVFLAINAQPYREPNTKADVIYRSTNMYV